MHHGGKPINPAWSPRNTTVFSRSCSPVTRQIQEGHEGGDQRLEVSMPSLLQEKSQAGCVRVLSRFPPHPTDFNKRARSKLGNGEGQADFHELGVREGFFCDHAEAAFAHILNLPFQKGCARTVSDLINTDLIRDTVQEGDTE
jgi:hypothetical protein